ncbi:trehalase-like domain-containing protein [Nocardia sp. NPDC058176]|uniref:trehalase-like domain-containing protein n=1 Tax=Nocardia sp. NPDC058176 TaxID=3346368 RepID=UPI0036DD6F15
MSTYPPIAEHGIVGDLQTAAPVSSDGTIDWWCAPRFDAPSVFASLLDSERGGYCRVTVVLTTTNGGGLAPAPPTWDEELDRVESEQPMAR